MSKSLPPAWFVHLLDNNGDLLAGGKIYTYAGGSSTPLVTYSDKDGATNTNPITLDSADRAAIWITFDTSYKFIVKDSSLATLFTVDGIIAESGIASTTTYYEAACSYVGTPGAQGKMCVHEMIRTATFPVDFAGASASVQTNPAATYAVSIQKNGVAVGSCSFSTAGVPTFTTVGGATVGCVFGDTLTFVGPDSVGTAADFGITLVGTL